MSAEATGGHHVTTSEAALAAERFYSRWWLECERNGEIHMHVDNELLVVMADYDLGEESLDAVRAEFEELIEERGWPRVRHMHSVFFDAP